MAQTDEWSDLAFFLADMIEKYVGQMDIDSLPDPNQHYRMKQTEEMYRRYMRIKAKIK